MIHRWESCLFLSDIHAGGGGNADDLTRWAWLLERLLNRCIEEKMPVAALGDILELWQFTPDAIRRTHSTAIDPLWRLISEGLGVYVPGNHDHEGAALCETAGVDFVAPTVIIESQGKKYYAAHGHMWDRWNRKPGWGHRLLLAATKKIEKVWPNVDVIDGRRAADRRAPKDESQDPLYKGAQTILNTGRYEGVIFGHTHRAGLWNLGSDTFPLWYANCGAWTNARTPSVVLLRDGLKVIHLEGERDFGKIWE